jgi:putative ATPase
MADLFADTTPAPPAAAGATPLAARMRPRTLEEYAGQEHILGPGKLLRRAIEADRISSIILFGPPGVGKTTLAHIIAVATQSRFERLSGVESSVADMRRVIASAANRLQTTGVRTILFIDEIHRFNKAQQDAFLPYVERGDVVLIGATTENPSFEINSALLSRTKVYTLYALDTPQLTALLRRALETPDRGLGHLDVVIDDDMLTEIAISSSGDARSALNTLEVAAGLATDGKIDRQALADALQRKILLYDKSGEEHFNLISALHKSVRSSDPDAALYWLARMMKAGEDRLYLARRLIRMAI